MNLTTIQEQFDKEVKGEWVWGVEDTKSFYATQINLLLDEVEETIKEFGVVHADYCAKSGSQFKECTACLFEKLKFKLNELRKY